MTIMTLVMAVLSVTRLRTEKKNDKEEVLRFSVLD